MELTPSSLAELIESDPALTVLVLRLCHNKGIIIKQCDVLAIAGVGGTVAARDSGRGVVSQNMRRACGGRKDRFQKRAYPPLAGSGLLR